jgi:hypothetical protein
LNPILPIEPFAQSGEQKVNDGQTDGYDKKNKKAAGEVIYRKYQCAAIPDPTRHEQQKNDQ